MKVTRLKCDHADEYTAQRAPTCECLTCTARWARAGGQLVTLADFWDQLEAHDWYHQMSDDGDAYRRGIADRNRLEALAVEVGLDAREMLGGFKAHYCVQVAPGCVRRDLPRRPRR